MCFDPICRHGGWTNLAETFRHVMVVARTSSQKDFFLKLKNKKIELFDHPVQRCYDGMNKV